MKSRIVAAALVALAVSGATGCAPQPEPAPTASAGFATDAEAFAAAEKTYRLYVDALNQVDLSDPETFEEVYRWTTGDANAGSRESFSQMHADTWTVGGESIVTATTPVTAHVDEITIIACLDVSAVTLVDESGSSVVAADRPAVQEVLVKAIPANSPTGLEIAILDGSDEGLCR